MAPTLSVKRTLADAAHDTETGLLELTKGQIRVLAMTRRTPRAVVFGGAGTGKTILACEKARQLRDAGNKVLLTCFNKLLARRLSQDQSLASIRVATFHSLCMSSANLAMVETPETPNTDWWRSGAPLVLMEAAERLKSILTFDAVVVDEGQDFTKDWLAALKEICASGADSPFYIFADEHQNLWDRDWEPEAEYLEIPLTTNCRNSRPISTRVAAISGSDLDDLGVDGPPAEWTTLKDPEDAPQLVQQAVEKLLKEGFNSSDVVVLCENTWLVQRLRGMTVADTGFYELDCGGVATETIARFKGLEAPAVVLVLTSKAPAQPDRNAYVGFSRARSYLHVVAAPNRKAFAKWG